MRVTLKVEDLRSVVAKMCEGCRECMSELDAREVVDTLAEYKLQSGAKQVALDAARRDVETLATMRKEVADEHGVPEEALIAKDNRPKMVAVRVAFAMRARAEGFSLVAIGRAMDKHHTTVLHMLTKGQA